MDGGGEAGAGCWGEVCRVVGVWVVYCFWDGLLGGYGFCFWGLGDWGVLKTSRMMEMFDPSKPTVSREFA